MKNITWDDFDPPTPEELARRNAMAEIRDEVGKLKNQLQADIKKLKKKLREENIPSVQTSLRQQITMKETQFKDVDYVFCEAGTDPAGRRKQDQFKTLIKWDEIMRKHGVPTRETD
jgi:hypothetical protein